MQKALVHMPQLLFFLFYRTYTCTHTALAFNREQKGRQREGGCKRRERGREGARVLPFSHAASRSLLSKTIDRLTVPVYSQCTCEESKKEERKRREEDVDALSRSRTSSSKSGDALSPTSSSSCRPLSVCVSERGNHEKLIDNRSTLLHRRQVSE